MSITRRSFTTGLTAALCGAAIPRAKAQSGTVRLVVGASPGGTTDLVARGLAQYMRSSLNQNVIVENKPGAAGNIAAQYVANAAPDGKTLLVCYTSFSINASLYKRLPFDPVRDFAPISLLAEVPSVLAVRSNFTARTMRELIDQVKAKPGSYSAGLGGLGSSLHMATEMLKLMAKLDFIDVPYPGSMPALTAMLGGQIDMMFASTQNVEGHVKAGTVRLLGVTSASRLKPFPDVPPIADTLPGFESYSWYGLFGPAKMPAQLIQNYNAAALAATRASEFKQLFERDAGEAKGGTPEELARFLQADIAKYAAIVKATGAHID